MLLKNLQPFFNKAVCAAVLLMLNFTTNAQVKIACIGDSITEGSGLSSTSESYPSQLQGLLRTSYSVGNFGKAGSALLKTSKGDYWTETVYKNALAWNPDVVIIKLGTNDSKAGNWVYKSRFYNDYVDFINSFKSLPSKPKIYICYPLPAYDNRYDIQEEVIKKEIIPIIKQVAKETNTTFIDLYTPFYGKKELLPDGVHPNAAGAKYLAQEVYKAIDK